MCALSGGALSPPSRPMNKRNRDTLKESILQVLEKTPDRKKKQLPHAQPLSFLFPPLSSVLRWQTGAHRTFTCHMSSSVPLAAEVSMASRMSRSSKDGPWPSHLAFFFSRSHASPTSTRPFLNSSCPTM